MFHYRVLGETTEKGSAKLAVLGIRIDSAVLAESRSDLELSGIRPHGITSAALAGWMTNPWKRFVLVTLEEEYTCCSIFRDGNLLMRRTLRIGARQLRGALEDYEDAPGTDAGGAPVPLYEIDGKGPGAADPAQEGTARTAVLPAIGFPVPEKYTRHVMVSLASFSSPAEAAAALPKFSSVPSRLLARKSDDGTTRFHIVANTSFSSQARAWGCLGGKKLPPETSASILPPYAPDTQALGRLSS